MLQTMADYHSSESTYLDSATGVIVWDPVPSNTIDKTPTTVADSHIQGSACDSVLTAVPLEDDVNSSGLQEGRTNQVSQSESQITNITSRENDDIPNSDANVINSNADNAEFVEEMDTGDKENIDAAKGMDFTNSKNFDVCRIVEQCEALDESDRLQISSALFMNSVVSRGQEFEEFVGCNFLRDTLEALEILSSCSVTNIVAHLVKSLKNEKLRTESLAFSLIESILVSLEDAVTMKDFPDQFKELLVKHLSPSVFDVINMLLFPKGNPRFVYHNNKGGTGSVFVQHVKSETQNPFALPQSEEHPGIKMLDQRKQKFECRYCGESFQKASLGKIHEDSLKCLTCTFCGTLFDSREAWREHLGSHASKTCHICTTCGKGFSRRENLSRHLKTVHLNEKAFTCKTCFKTFSEKANLEQHIRLHTGEKPFTCSICNEIFRTRQLYSKHLKRAHDVSVKDVKVDNVFECAHCDRTFHRENDLGRHVAAAHGDVKAYECGTCQRTFSTKNQLMEHERIHTGEKPFACDLCSDTFRTKGLYHRHVAFKHKDRLSKAEPVPAADLVCKICDKLFNRKDNLLRHWKAIHVNDRIFACTTCKASFNQQAKLDDHVRLHTGETPYLCTKCPQSFRTQELYRKHVASSHGFICEICNLKFKSASSLAWHRKTHQDKDKLLTRFKCPGCPKSFPFRYQRERHFRQMHRGIKKSMCKVCGRRTNNLSEHMAVHDRRIRFTCETCGQGFIHRASYKRHVVGHLGLQLNCPLCQKRFTTPEYLRTHLSRVHKNAAIELHPEKPIILPGTSLPDHIRVRKGGRKPNDGAESVLSLTGGDQINLTDQENPDNILLQDLKEPEAMHSDVVQTVTEFSSQPDTEAVFENYGQSGDNQAIRPWDNNPYETSVQLIPTPMDAMDAKEEMTDIPHIVMITKADGSQGAGSDDILQLVPTAVNVQDNAPDLANLVQMIPKSEDLQHIDKDSV